MADFRSVEGASPSGYPRLQPSNATIRCKLSNVAGGGLGDKFSTLLMGVPTYVLPSPLNATEPANLQNYTTPEDLAQSPSPYYQNPNEDFQSGVEDVAFLTRNESVSDLDVSEAPLSQMSSNLGNDSDASENPITEFDTTAATPNPSPAPTPVPTPEGITEKFLVPLLSFQIGAGNQFMEYLSASVIARSLNRTLCLSPFFAGPLRHTGLVKSGLAWEDRFEVSLFSKFTRVASLQQCLEQCNYTLDDMWMLKTSRDPIIEKWKKYPSNKEALNLNWHYVGWMAPKDIFATLGSRDARCVGLLGLFPGLRWRGAFLAPSAFIRPAPRINRLADRVQEYALGEGTRYLSVHWRFEESECNGHHVGLCFVRCDDGAVINSGLHSQAKEWRKACPYANGHFPGVLLDKRDIVDTIEERALNQSVTSIYLASDGWIRGPESIALLKETVETLRKRNLTVVGLWKLPGLPNFADGTYFNPATTFGKDNGDLNGAQIALLEQELCSRAVSFLGSGPSTLSLAVFRQRLARRRVKEITEAAEREGGANVKLDSKAMDDLVAETLLKDNHPAGLHCRYLRFMNRFTLNETAETYADEYPDGWLDLEACEGRIGRGGRCDVAKCF